ncbi:MAG: VanW family protein [Patescibacteria group bacterium]|nr:VanW family protein [Patescibacteria group bacterium]
MLAFFKKPEGEDKKPRHWPLYLTAVFFILADIAVASYFIFEENYKNKAYPGVSVGRLSLGGKTADEARKIIETKINDINQNGIRFNYDQSEATVTPIISSFNGDIALQVINFNTDDMVSRAVSIGRNGGIYHNIREQLAAMLSGWRIPASFSTNDDLIKKILADNFGRFAAPAENAKLFATTTVESGKKELSLEINDEKLGYEFDYDQVLLRMKADLEKFDNSPIELFPVKSYPDIGKNDIAPFLSSAQKFLEDSALTLVYADKKWPVAKEKFAAWLTVDRATGSKIALDLDKSKINDFLNQKAAPQIEIPPADARFQITDGRVVQFSKSQIGMKIDLDQTYKNLQADFLKGGKNTVNIAVATVTSAIGEGQTNNLGITEIIGTGHSNFAGSPKNRIHNIGVGAASLNGLLIPPGTEFSVDKSLGEVTAATGYLPEMTIMGDKTVAQYGGGLCQIGTTVFRAALASGFPITARQAHSYRVVYYEPAGTDATIYQPWPDLRFINDSPNYILIQTRISGNDLYFDFWGTKDGRIVEESDPTIYNIVKPLPTKYTETLSLPPGQKKCTERAHNGADAFFDYKVTYPDGTVKQKRFTSHYVPWREVCLIGVAQLSTSTPATIK